MSEGKDSLFITRMLPKWALYSLALVPLVVTDGTLFPRIFGKGGFIKLSIALFLIFLIIYLYKDRAGDIRAALHKLKHPIYILSSSFLALTAVGVFLAESPYRALWGNVERGGGLIFYFYLWVFLTAIIVLFNKKDWAAFLKLSLFVGLILSIDAMPEYFQSLTRAGGSFIGNPAFLSVYGIFFLFSAIVISAQEKNMFWRVFGWLSIPLSVSLIVATQTRGALVGLVVGLVAALIYLVLRGRGKTIKIFNLRVGVRAAALTAISILALSSGLIYVTRENPIWDNVPGVNRMTEISLDDDSVATRIKNIQISLNAVNPNTAGWQKALLGWGTENYSQAHSLNYDPSLQKYETNWFDKAHNMPLEVLVTHGYLGLILYLSMWAFLLIQPFSRKEEESGGVDYVALASILFGFSYFTQNIFLFDHMTSYIPLHFFIGFSIYKYPWKNSAKKIHYGDFGLISKKILGFVLAAIAVFLMWILIWTAYIPYRQMTTIGEPLERVDLVGVEEALEESTHPNNYAQGEIRRKLLSTFSSLSINEDVIDPLKRVLELNEAVLHQAIDKPKYRIELAFAYKQLGQFLGEEELIRKGEEHLRLANKEAPGRQHTMFLLADNLVAQGRFEEAFSLADELYSIEPEGKLAHTYKVAILAPYSWKTGENVTSGLFQHGDFTLSTQIIRASYSNYLVYFARQKDAEGFIKTNRVALELEELIGEVGNEYYESGSLDSPPALNTENIIMGLRLFSEIGWSAVKAF